MIHGKTSAKFPYVEIVMAGDWRGKFYTRNKLTNFKLPADCGEYYDDQADETHLLAHLGKLDPSVPPSVAVEVMVDDVCVLVPRDQIRRGVLRTAAEN